MSYEERLNKNWLMINGLFSIILLFADLSYSESTTFKVETQQSKTETNGITFSVRLNPKDASYTGEYKNSSKGSYYSVKNVSNTITNYPNPFAAGREVTTIEYYLEQDANVTLKIYDLFGNLVYQQEFLIGEVGGKSGTNLISWDGKNGSGEIVSNGGYICCITAKTSSGTTVLKRKISVVK